MSIMQNIKSGIRSWLEIEPANIPEKISIYEPLSFETNVIKNKLWYRGDADELRQFYQSCTSNITSATQTKFWASNTRNDKLRRIHTGLPAIIVDTITNLVVADLQNVEFDKAEDKTVWEQLTDNNDNYAIDFKSIIKQAITETLYAGDGAFKISFDFERSNKPILSFVSADRVEYEYSGSKIKAILFWKRIYEGKKEYQFREKYEAGKITYKLFNSKREEVPIETIERLKEYKPVSFDGDFIMALPLKFFESSKFTGRGKSIYDTKIDNFDMLDEVVSQWLDAIRAGRVVKYVPADMIPVDDNGNYLMFDDFGSEYVQTMQVGNETQLSKLETVQPDIKYDAFVSSYSTALDMCLQGLISPATLGINLGKQSSAESQREKKDVTGMTRNNITTVLEKVLPQLISIILKSYDVATANQVGVHNTATVSFGEYGAPDFDTRVTTVTTAAQSGIMSIYAQVDELWGDSKDEEWKAKEVQRIKEEKGLTEATVPQVGEEFEI